MTYFCITINAHPHSGWFCVKHYLISLKRNSIALHGLKPHKNKAAIRLTAEWLLRFFDDLCFIQLQRCHGSTAAEYEQNERAKLIY